MTRSRIVKMLVAFAALGLSLAIGLADLMVVEHEDWLERSYRNRWAFRDVPTRRGSILDRNGVVLAADEPGFDLELHYREFRRVHTVGLAVHGANLLQRAHGLLPTFRFDAPDGFEPAMRLLLELPVRWFGSEGDVVARQLGARGPIAPEHVRDVRFYVCALLARLADGVAAPEFHVGIRRALRERTRSTVRDFAAAVCADVGARRSRACVFDPSRLRQRVAELADCATRLGDLDPSPEHDVDLFEFLESRRRAWAEWDAFCELPKREQFALRDPAFCAFVAGRGVELGSWRGFGALAEDRREELLDAFASLAPEAKEALPARAAAAPWNEDVPRAVRRRMPYETATWLRLLGDRHPGFRLRPAVRRVHGELPGERDLGSLEAALGSVTPLWRNDTGPDLRGWTESLASLGLEDFFARWEDTLPDGMRETLRSSAGSAVFHHYVQHGRRGRGGVEQVVDGLLAGAPGMRFVERDRRSEQRLFSALDVQPGRDVRLTIDVGLQVLLDRELRGADAGTERAAAIIDAKSGDVLAMSSWPLVGEDGERRWTSAAAYPTMTPYVGSVVKPIVVLEHLDAVRDVRPAAEAAAFRPCRRDEEFARTRLRCNCRGGGPAGQDPVLALAHSCNWYLFTATVGLGERGLRHGLARFELAGAEIGQASESTVFGLPRGASASARLHAGGIQLAKQGIGYGVEANVLAVARAYAGLATGALPTLSLVATERRRPLRRLDVHPDDLETVRRGLRGCVDFGTARNQDWVPFGVVGKTGTAEITADLRENNAWFAGYAAPTADGLQLAFAVALYRVPDRTGGGGAAAPIVHRVLEAIRADADLADRYLPAGVR